MSRSAIRFTLMPVCIVLAGLALWSYPLPPLPLAVGLLVYTLALIRFPSIWLLVLPPVIAGLDLSPWTGWMLLGEQDLFLLATIGVLGWRAMPVADDVALPPRLAWVTGLFVVAMTISLGIGIAVAQPAGGTDNIYLSWLNGLRMTKPLLTGLTLMPFAMRRQRLQGDLLVLFAAGMMIALFVVSAEVVTERVAFVDLFDFHSDYRVVGPFASMHLGGGHIGAFLALSLPFAAICLLRLRAWTAVSLVLVGALALYALAVTFARAAYASALLALVAAVLTLVITPKRGRTMPWLPALAGLLLLLPIGVGLAAASMPGSYMANRFRTMAPDLATRLSNWAGGLELRANDPVSVVFGAGIGSFPRLALAARGEIDGLSDFQASHQGRDTFLTLHNRRPIYFSQKVPLIPGRPYIVSLRAKLQRGERLGVALCERVLLYSDNCATTTFSLTPGAAWAPFSSPISVTDPNWDRGPFWPRRQIDLVLLPPAGTTLEVTDVHLRDEAGTDIVANHAFAQGTARWYFTDDDHLAWRMKDQYLMSWFETGAFGLFASCLLFLAALATALRTVRAGDRVAACLVGSLAAIAMSSVFDTVFESPRLATLIYLVLGMAIISGRRMAPP